MSKNLEVKQTKRYLKLIYIVETTAQFSCCGKSWLESKGCNFGKHIEESNEPPPPKDTPVATAATAGGTLVLKKVSSISGIPEKLEYARALSANGHLLKASAVAKRLHESTSLPSLLKQQSTKHLM